MFLFTVVLVAAFLVGLKLTADLIKTRSRKCNVFHHLGAPANPSQSDTHAD